MQAIPKKGTCLKGHPLAGYCTYTDNPKKRDRDASSVSVAQLRELLNRAGDIDREILSQRSEVYIRSIHRIFRPGEQTTIGITMTDRILLAVAQMGYGEYRLGIDLTVFPSITADDALTMAVQENLDDDDVLTADQAQIEARIEELMALRKEMVG